MELQLMAVHDGESLNRFIKNWGTISDFTSLIGKKRRWLTHLFTQPEIKMIIKKEIIELINENAMEIVGEKREVGYDEVFNFSPSSVTNSVGKGNLQTGDNSSAIYEEKGGYDSREMADMRMQLQVKD